jgi:hypothetical protein
MNVKQKAVIETAKTFGTMMVVGATVALALIVVPTDQLLMIGGGALLIVSVYSMYRMNLDKLQSKEIQARVDARIEAIKAGKE